MTDTTPQPDPRPRLSEAAIGGDSPHGVWLRSVIPPLRDLVRVSRDDRLVERVGHEAGVRVPTHLVLALTRIGDFQPVRLSDLADRMEVGRTTLSRQVAELVAAGFVRRTPDPDDARAAALELTDHGEETLRRIWSAWSDVIAEVTRDWPEADREALPVLLGRLTSGLRSLTENAPKPPTR
ncbi:MarR family winged helix-turn-helix transcriptional regulator [Embleya hyalina]|uniref:MarR family transcriptional regulator n=1 Tax=Embleya hyalina TaxID=516124 RepID=A0A401YE24_9ACTN|nr:MarR family winged helix-turn-helix transcriptional regulator [Embleya hyalina]GCD92851.1 MarR family transcriptional regulator [Embleya hyalina]